jgi:hypothetical protein
MPVRRVTSVCLPVSTRAAVEFHRYDSRTPILVIRAGYPPVLVTLTLPERVEEGHVQFACQLARQAARYALEVERTSRGLPALAPPRHHGKNLAAHVA